MNLSFASRKLEKVCSQQREAVQVLGPEAAKRLRARLADIQAAAQVSDLVAGSPHPLVVDRAGEFALSLGAGKRLVFRPSHSPVPRKDDGSIDWRAVQAVTITFVGDYHG